MLEVISWIGRNQSKESNNWLKVNHFTFWKCSCFLLQLPSDPHSHFRTLPVSIQLYSYPAGPNFLFDTADSPHWPNNNLKMWLKHCEDCFKQGKEPYTYILFTTKLLSFILKCFQQLFWSIFSLINVSCNVTCHKSTLFSPTDHFYVFLSFSGVGVCIPAS